MILTVRPEEYDLSVAIQFPASPSGVIAGAGIRIWNVGVNPEVEIVSCERFALHADAEGVVWGEADIWADLDGNPLFDGKPMRDLNHRIITKVFRVHVAKILSTTSYNRGYEQGYVQLHGAPLTAAKRMRGRKMVEA